MTMRKKTVRYTKGEIGKVKVVKDFLPPPDHLVPRKKECAPDGNHQSSSPKGGTQPGLQTNRTTAFRVLDAE